MFSVWEPCNSHGLGLDLYYIQMPHNKHLIVAAGEVLDDLLLLL